MLVFRRSKMDSTASASATVSVSVSGLGTHTCTHDEIVAHPSRSIFDAPTRPTSPCTKRRVRARAGPPPITSSVSLNCLFADACGDRNADLAAAIEGTNDDNWFLDTAQLITEPPTSRQGSFDSLPPTQLMTETLTSPAQLLFALESALLRPMSTPGLIPFSDIASWKSRLAATYPRPFSVGR